MIIDVQDRITEIEYEYNSQFDAVVNTFIEAGHTVYETAKELECHGISFASLMRNKGWLERFKSPPPPCRKPAIWRIEGRDMSVRDHAIRMGLKSTTLRARIKKTNKMIAENDPQSLEMKTRHTLVFAERV